MLSTPVDARSRRGTRQVGSPRAQWVSELIFLGATQEYVSTCGHDSVFGVVFQSNPPLHTYHLHPSSSLTPRSGSKSLLVRVPACPVVDTALSDGTVLAALKNGGAGRPPSRRSSGGQALCRDGSTVGEVDDCACSVHYFELICVLIRLVM